ncbi:hypothetical protein CN899_21220 [Bacillus thuringiensis]|uniref:Phage protein n=1 Tax=Bacillus thuringiensis TaxID=1428 RepID=A0A9X7BXH1_BACTU|nr:hypothetical protein [Bacillus thuringiensis]PGH81065.1 hypothetical protein CN899_21220 [Bacillus thuringiensis]
MKVLRDPLREWEKQIKQTKKKNKTKPKENFSVREIEELMGIHRPCYERRNGAMRQK